MSASPEFLPGQPSSLRLGQMLAGRYRIVGDVYQARDLDFPNTARLCAVKEMIRSLQGQLCEQIIRDFEHEAEILASLQHPAIPQIYDFFGIGGRVYLVMEFIEGRDLEAILNGTEAFLGTEQIRQWAIEICEVWGYPSPSSYTAQTTQGAPFLL